MGFLEGFWRGGAGSGGRVGQKLISRGDKYNDASKGRKTKTRKKIEINRRMQKKGEEIAKKNHVLHFF